MTRRVRRRPGRFGGERPRLDQHWLMCGHCRAAGLSSSLAFRFCDQCRRRKGLPPRSTSSMPAEAGPECGAPGTVYVDIDLSHLPPELLEQLHPDQSRPQSEPSDP